MDYIQALLDSTQTLINKAVQEQLLNNSNIFKAIITEQPTLQKNKGYLYNGIRMDTTQNTKITLYSNTDIFQVDDIVTILSPNSGTNYILGYYYDNLTNSVKQYQNPEKDLLKCGNTLVFNTNIKLPLGDQEYSFSSVKKELNILNKNPDRLYIETSITANFFNNEDFYENIKSGTYGIKVDLIENQTGNLYSYCLDSSINMYENAFDLQSDLQNICFDISAISNGVKYATITYYHKGDFKNFYDEFPTLSENNSYITLNNINIYLAYDVNKLTEDGVIGIDIEDNIELIYKETDEKFVKLFANWIQYDFNSKKFNYYSNNNKNTNSDVELRWYKYSYLEKANDYFGGDNWILINRQKKDDTYIIPSEHQHDYEIEQELVTSLEENKFKLVIIDKNKVYKSNEIVFKKEEEKKQVDGLSLTLTEFTMPEKIVNENDETVFDFTTCNGLNYEGKYEIYKKNGSINTDPFLIKLSATLDNEEEFASPQYTKIVWKVPKNYSMFSSNRKELNLWIENGYWGITDENINPIIRTYSEDFEQEKSEKRFYERYSDNDNWYYEKYFIKQVIEKKDSTGKHTFTTEILENFVPKAQEDFYLSILDFYNSSNINNVVTCEVYLEYWDYETQSFISELKQAQQFKFIFDYEPTNINGYKLKVSFLSPDDYTAIGTTENHKLFQTDKLSPFRTTMVGKIVLEDSKGQQIDLSSGDEIKLDWKTRPTLDKDSSVTGCYKTTTGSSGNQQMITGNMFASVLTKENVQDYTHFQEVNSGYFAVSENQDFFNKDAYLKGASRAEYLYQSLLGAGEAETSAIEKVEQYCLGNSVDLSNIEQEAFLDNNKNILCSNFSNWTTNFNILKISIKKYNITEYVPIILITNMIGINKQLQLQTIDNILKYKSNGKFASSNRTSFAWIGPKNETNEYFCQDGAFICLKSLDNSLIEKISKPVTSGSYNVATLKLKNQYNKNKTQGCFSIGTVGTGISGIALIPLHITKDIAITKNIENWDGKTAINKTSEEVTGEKLIAGEKNSNDNSFSGIYLGSIDTKEVNNGIVGFQSGEETFSINATKGILTLGSGENQIVIDGNTGIITIGGKTVDLSTLLK